jgi:hypothetical protein
LLRPEVIVFVRCILLCFAGAQGLVGPQGCDMACATRTEFSAAATGIGAAVVAAIAAAMVDRLPASRADFNRLVCIACSCSTALAEFAPQCPDAASHAET